VLNGGRSAAAALSWSGRAEVTRDKITRTAPKRWNQGADYALQAGGIFQVPLSGRFRILRLLDAN
jgi:hypothetical protein